MHLCGLNWLILLSLALGDSISFGQTNEADRPYSWPVQRPADLSHLEPSNHFTSFVARAEGPLLVVSWESPIPADTAQVWTAPKGLGNRPPKNWSRHPATSTKTNWNAEIPIPSLDDPIIYFVAMERIDGSREISPIRLCHPRALGLPKPSLPSSSFLEGFEDGSWNWRLEDDRATAERVEGGRLSRHSLKLTIPESRRSATVSTTRVRDAAMANAAGFELWLRSDSTNGAVQITAVAYVGSDTPISVPFPQTIVPQPAWACYEFRFNTLPNFPLGGLDQLIIEFTGVGPMSLWIDDLELSQQ